MCLFSEALRFLGRLLVAEVRRDGVPVRTVGQVASQRVRNFPRMQGYITQ